MTSVGFAVAQKMRHTSEQFLIAFNTLMGNASLRRMTKAWPAPIIIAFSAATLRNSSSLPSTRIRQGPDASQKAIPNLDYSAYLQSHNVAKCHNRRRGEFGGGLAGQIRRKISFKVIRSGNEKTRLEFSRCVAEINIKSAISAPG